MNDVLTLLRNAWNNLYDARQLIKKNCSLNKESEIVLNLIESQLNSINKLRIDCQAKVRNQTRKE